MRFWLEVDLAGKAQNQFLGTRFLKNGLALSRAFCHPQLFRTISPESHLAPLARQRPAKPAAFKLWSLGQLRVLCVNKRANKRFLPLNAI
jgi:hypothetical protein